MKKITWSIDAENDFDENIDYLLKEWSVIDAIEFVDKVENILFNLKKGLVKYQPSKYKDINKSVICKQITLYYKEKDKNEIELVRFWNTHKDEKKLKL